MIISDYIFKRLKLIQKRNNFNPNLGKKQINNQPNKLNDYIIFAEYIALVKKLNLDIEIPYDPLGLKYKTIKIKQNKVYVYFARLTNNINIWKIGHSTVPYKRGKTLQTGNHESLTVMYTIDGSFELEQIILRYTEKFETSGGTEWRHLDSKEIKLIISRIKSEGTDFLVKSTLSK